MIALQESLVHQLFLEFRSRRFLLQDLTSMVSLILSITLKPEEPQWLVLVKAQPEWACLQQDLTLTRVQLLNREVWILRDLKPPEILPLLEKNLDPHWEPLANRIHIILLRARLPLLKEHFLQHLIRRNWSNKSKSSMMERDSRSWSLWMLSRVIRMSITMLRTKLTQSTTRVSMLTSTTNLKRDEIGRGWILNNDNWQLFWVSLII